jgi:hypothetical protein
VTLDAGHLLTVDGQTYLVAPRGTTQRVKNIRVAGGGELRVGRRTASAKAEQKTARDLARARTQVPAS